MATILKLQTTWPAWTVQHRLKTTKSCLVTQSENNTAPLPTNQIFHSLFILLRIILMVLNAFSFKWIKNSLKFVRLLIFFYVILLKHLVSSQPVPFSDVVTRGYIEMISMLMWPQSFIFSSQIVT